MQDETFNRRFAEAYEDKLASRDIDHPKKFLITFCGVPGSGKSTLAKRLTADLQAQYISNDEIRDMLRSEDQTLEGIVIGEISRKVVEDISASDPNKLIVLDSSIDRTWRNFFDTAKKIQAQTLVIRMNCTREELKGRLHKRPNAEAYFEARIDMFIDQFTNCKQQLPADIELESNYLYDDVVTRVKEILAAE